MMKMLIHGQLKQEERNFHHQKEQQLLHMQLVGNQWYYSPDRVLYPMKRVDFDPDGERNYENRGVSGYERILWDEALDIVSKEIIRVRKKHGPEWARSMVCLVAMQGLGKSGINFGGLQYVTPLDTLFFFPGYADGGFSGDYMSSGDNV